MQLPSAAVCGTWGNYILTSLHFPLPTAGWEQSGLGEGADDVTRIIHALIFVPRFLRENM